MLWRLFELFPSLPASDATAAALLHFFRCAVSLLLLGRLTNRKLKT